MKNTITLATLTVLVLVGGGVALDSACSPSAPVDTNDGGPVCDPDSGDPAGCSCDPGTVKTATCYTGPAGTESKGICKTGTRSCTSNGTYTACVGEVLPQPETCNYADDDCNGIIDDLPEIADASAIAYCTSPSCAPDFADAAITCWGPDPGICGAGTLACKGGPGGGTPTGCNEFVHTPTQEICNGIDDDCNGEIDDNLNQDGPCDMPAQSLWPDGSDPFEAGADGSLITRVYGECIHGNLTCVDTSCGDHGCADAGDQCFPSQPTVESCDGLDNDCNGVVDDHACGDSVDVEFGDIYCCNDGFNDYFCTDQSETQFYTCNKAN
jgi:hypothetical protein